MMAPDGARKMDEETERLATLNKCRNNTDWEHRKLPDPVSLMSRAELSSFEEHEQRNAERRGYP